MNTNLAVDLNRTDARSYYAEDRHDPRFFIEGVLRTTGREQVLSFIVVARLMDGTRGVLSGMDFFTAMMDHFGDNAVDVIEGQWEALNPNWTTNLDAFNHVTATTNLPLEAAAAMVPTGIYATRRGYRRVCLVRAVGNRGRYTEAVFHFRK